MKFLKLFEDYNKEDFYLKNNIDPEKLSYLGKGDYGTAYSIDNTGKVLKITSSYSEYEIAKQLIGKSNEYDGFVEFYDAAEINGKYYIIGEEVEEDSRIEDLYYDLSNMLETQGLPMQYLEYFDKDAYEGTWDSEMEHFMGEISTINRSYRMLGIEASDLTPENLGRDKDGNLKAFDIEDRRKEKYKR
jgi:hypothetical protein